MFLPAHYRISEIPKILSFIRENSFAIITTQGEEGINASHIPIEIEENDDQLILHGHLSRANTQWKDFENGRKALAIFSGPHTYVSSRWYNHPNAPTWNYVAVHAEGRMEIMSEQQMRDSLTQLLSHHEPDTADAITLQNLPDDLVDKYLKAIVGFKLYVEKLEGKWKMSQNRNSEDFENIIKELEKIDDVNAKLVAAEMSGLKK